MAETCLPDAHLLTSQDDDLELLSNMFKARKADLEGQQKLQGLHPHDFDLPPKSSAYASFNSNVASRRFKATRSPSKAKYHIVYTAAAYPPCFAPVESLQPIAISQLQFHVHLRGNYILLRSMTPSYTRPLIGHNAIDILGEDESGDAIQVCLLYQDFGDFRKSSDFVDEGTVFLVKEPFLQIDCNQRWYIRVDHCSDVVVLDADDDRIPQIWQNDKGSEENSATSLKLKGDALIQEKSFWKATIQYTKALQQPTALDEMIIIKRNRALAYLRIGHFDAALKDTGYPDFGEEPNEKALYRAAEALYELRRFKEAKVLLRKHESTMKFIPEALALLVRAEKRCKEETTGQYPWAKLQADATELNPPLLDYGSYIGPMEVRESEGKGRGMFLTRSVKAGELLLCEKAFAAGFVPQDKRNAAEWALILNAEACGRLRAGQAIMTAETIQKIHRNPSLAVEFMELHRGPQVADMTTSDTNTHDSLDSFVIAKIVKCNSFGLPEQSTLRLACPASTNTADKTKNPLTEHNGGIWLKASLLNHKCISNACYAFIGDMIVVRAAQDLEKDGEVFVWYHPPNELAGPVMMARIQQAWGFQCDCKLCHMAKDSEAALRKMKASIELKKHLEVTTVVAFNSDRMARYISKAEKLLRLLEHNYPFPAAEAPRYMPIDSIKFMIDFQAALSDMPRTLGLLNKALSCLCFEFVGLDATPTAFRITKWGQPANVGLELMVRISQAFQKLGAPSDAAQAKNYARISHACMFGADTSFDKIFTDLSVQDPQVKFIGPVGGALGAMLMQH